MAGYQAIFDVGCKCITANYTLNDDGTVHVVNECQELGLPVTIEGTASTADAAYGDAGVFDVVLNGYGSACPGPNYIVQGKSCTTLIGSQRALWMRRQKWFSISQC